jgi:hypothetical protein
MDPTGADPHSLGTAFTVWAAVVGLVGAAIVYELARVRGELKQLGSQLNTYIVSMERRVTAMETHMRLRYGFSPAASLDDVFANHNGG